MEDNSSESENEAHKGTVRELIDSEEEESEGGGHGGVGVKHMDSEEGGQEKEIEVDPKKMRGCKEKSGK